MLPFCLVCYKEVGNRATAGKCFQSNTDVPSLCSPSSWPGKIELDLLNSFSEKP